MLSDPAPRPPHCYDPATPPHRDEQGVHVYDHATIRGLLRDPQRVTSDVSEMLTPDQRDRLHPVSSFVWATDRRTLSGCPGRHTALRSALAPWFAVDSATSRAPVAAEIAAELLDARTEAHTAGGAFDVYLDYALPMAVTYLADWLGIAPSDVIYAVEDQFAAGDMFAVVATAGHPGDGRVLPRADAPTGSDRHRRDCARPGRSRGAHRAGVVGRRCTRSRSARWRPRRRPR